MGSLVRKSASRWVSPDAIARRHRLGHNRKKGRIGGMVAAKAWIAGTFDTKGRELFYLRDCLKAQGIASVTVDLSTSAADADRGTDLRPADIAALHPQGPSAIFTGERGSAVAAMAEAFTRFILSREDVGGLVSAGGSGACSLATPAMRALPLGVPKLMVTTMAAGDTRIYVGSSDIALLYPVTDIAGLNRISAVILAKAAGALAGMMKAAPPANLALKPAIGLTMFGVTTPCVQMVTAALEDRYDCIVFHATGAGGRSFEQLAAAGMFSGVIDVTTTEIADEIAGGVLTAGPERLDAFASRAIPYVGSLGAVDMANFFARETVPPALALRQFHVHNANVTLMRTTPVENAAIGAFIAAKLNRMKGPVRFLIPEDGVSALDAPGKPFHDPEAMRALTAALRENFVQSAGHRLISLPLHINDPAFADALVAAFLELQQQ
jgi:uncharacterized protein (UPF0261 family)